MKQTRRVVEYWKTKELISAVNSGKLDLSTDYQRDTIWDSKRKELLVDSILHNIDIPKIYLAYFTNGDKYECVDGKQRIYSIIEFYNGSLQTKSGEYFKNLKDKSLFLDYDFSVSVIKNPTADDILELFYRLNIGKPINGGELIHAMSGDMRRFIFKTIGEKGPFIGEVGMKEYRFSRETAIAQMIINSIYFRGKEFRRARYEDISNFLREDDNKKFSSVVNEKTKKFYSTLEKVQDAFGVSAHKLNRKSAIVSAYLFCEEIIDKKEWGKLEKFPSFYLQLLDEMRIQGDYVKDYKEPKRPELLANFQKHLQQASAENYSIKARHEFLEKIFSQYLKNGKI